jgi:hypothetical protein
MTKPNTKDVTAKVRAAGIDYERVYTNETKLGFRIKFHNTWTENETAIKALFPKAVVKSKTQSYWPFFQSVTLYFMKDKK